MKSMLNVAILGLACLLPHPALANTGNVDVYGSIGSSTDTGPFASDGSAGALYVTGHLVLAAPEDHTFRFTRLEIASGSDLSFSNLGAQDTLTLLASEAIVIKGWLDPMPALNLTLAAPRLYIDAPLSLPGGRLALIGTDSVEIGHNAILDVSSGSNAAPSSETAVARLASPGVEISGGIERAAHGELTIREISNWPSFNIDSQARVNLSLPSAPASTLDRINAGGDLSLIAGRLTGRDVQIVSSSLEAGVLTLSAPGGLALVQSGESLAMVPEPETYAMLLAGLALVGLAVRRRKAGR